MLEKKSRLASVLELDFEVVVSERRLQKSVESVEALHQRVRCKATDPGNALRLGGELDAELGAAESDARNEARKKTYWEANGQITRRIRIDPLGTTSGGDA